MNHSHTSLSHAQGRITLDSWPPQVSILSSPVSFSPALGFASLFFLVRFREVVSRNSTWVGI